MIDALAWKVQSRLVEIVCASPTKEQDSVDAKAYAQLKEQRLASAALAAESAPQEHVVDIEALEMDFGPPEIPVKFGAARSSAIHPNHTLDHKRGVVWCKVCGAYGTTRGRNCCCPANRPLRRALPSSIASEGASLRITLSHGWVSAAGGCHVCPCYSICLWTTWPRKTATGLKLLLHPFQIFNLFLRPTTVRWTG